MRKDLYQTLGIDPRAREEDIKRAYRRVALKCHPDRNVEDPEAEERFKEANHAYSILGDRDKRKRYDLYREFQSRSIRWGFAPPQSTVFSKAVEDFFLNASVPGFGAGFPWTLDSFSRVHPLVSFTTGTFHFLKRLFLALHEEKLVRIPLEVSLRPFAWARTRLSVRPRHGDHSNLWAQENGDLEWTLPLSIEEARKGTQLMLSFPINSVWEKVRLRVPPGVRDGVRLRVRNKGMQIGEKFPLRGDLYLRIRVN